MAPASLAILTRTFHGRERGTAFSMWAAVMGAAVAFGPVLGGFLTTEYSWRAAFVINVVIVPFVLVAFAAKLAYELHLAPKPEYQMERAQ